MRLSQWVIAGSVLLSAAGSFAANTKQEAVMGEDPSVSPKKVLVVYYSRTGNTKKIAEDIAKAVDADIEQLIDKKDRGGAGGYLIAGKDAARENPAEIEPVKTDPAKYGLVVVGTPVWAWNMSPAVRTYITAHKAALKDIAFFTSAGATKPDGIVGKMEALAGKKARASEGFFDRELKDTNTASYEAKLNAFISRLK